MSKNHTGAKQALALDAFEMILNERDHSAATRFSLAGLVSALDAVA
jgi:hypothetical protein